jgi:hypothetical protein
VVFSVTSVGCTNLVCACCDKSRMQIGWSAATVTVTSQHSARNSRCSGLIYYDYSTLLHLTSIYNVAYVP